MQVNNPPNRDQVTFSCVKCEKDDNYTHIQKDARYRETKSLIAYCPMCGMQTKFKNAGE